MKQHPLTLNRQLLALSLLCAYFVSTGLRAQTFRNLSLQDGLSDHIIWTIAKDASGFVWMGTSCSVERFDGCHIRSYLMPGTDESAKKVNALADVPGEGMWVGTRRGLWCIPLGAVAPERMASDTITGEVNALLNLASSGELMVGTDNGLYILSPGRLEHLLLEPDALSPANTIMDMTADSLGTLWMATRGGLYALTLAERRVQAYTPHDNSFPTSYVKVCQLDQTVYLGTWQGGIIAMDIPTRRFSHYMDTGWPVTALAADPAHGLLHVASDGGGIQFVRAADRAVVRTIRHNPQSSGGLSSNSVYSLLVDREGIVWAGLYQLGLDYSLYQSGLFTIFNLLPDFDLSHAAIRSVETQAEGILVGTREGLYFADDSRGIRRHYGPPEMRSQMVLCSHYHEGRYYIGTYSGGMYVLDARTATLRDFDPHLQQPMQQGSVFSITTDHLGRLWAGTSNGLLCYHPDGRLIAHYHNLNSRLSSDYVFCIFFDSMHRGWVCTDSEIMLLTEGADGTVSLSDKLPEGFIHQTLCRSVFEDSNHQLYFVPDRGNVFSSDLSLSHFHEIGGTPFEGKNVRFVIEDDDHWLWMGTSDGLYRYDQQSHFDAYDFTDGLPTTTFLGCIPRRDAQGGLWMGSSQGVVYTDMERINRDWRTGYSLAVTGMLADNESIPLPRAAGRRVSLPPVRERLTLGLSQFTYTDPRYMAYEYRLDGKDKEWRLLSGESEVTYYRLPPRSYTFRLRHPGQPESEVTFGWVVRHAVPLYVTVPIAIVVLAAIVVGVMLWNRRRRKHLALAAAQEAEEEMAAAEGDGTATGEETAEVPNQKYRFSKVSPEECQALADRLDRLMREEKLYVNPSLKIGDLAVRLDVSAYKLSYLFNQHLNISFYDYVNSFRIAEFKEMVARGENKSYTIDAMMNRCGFVSRTTFFRYFKKVNGQTPNEYIRSRG